MVGQPADEGRQWNPLGPADHPDREDPVTEHRVHGRARRSEHLGGLLGGEEQREGRQAPPGDLLAYPPISGDFRVWFMRPDVSGEPLLTDSWQDEPPTWAPNGRVIQFFRTERNTGKTSVWQVDLTGRNERKLPTPVDGSDPAWGPVLP